MLRLFYDDNGSQHGDVTLILDEYVSRGDSYYFSLDRKLDGVDESPAKVRRVLAALLNQWRAGIEALTDSPLYLLAQLDDESTTWLMVSAKGDHVMIKALRSTLEGYRVWPSQGAATTREPVNLAPITRGKTTTQAELLADVDRCLRMLAALDVPQTDPTPLFEHYRGTFGTQLLTAAVDHLGLFDVLGDRALARADFLRELNLEERPFVVLTTALRAMGLLESTPRGEFQATPLALEHLRRSSRFDVSDYVRLSSSSPDVVAMAQRLKSNRPQGMDDGTGTAFIARDGVRSAMDEAEQARFLTMSLAGRGRNVAPVLAERHRLPEARVLLDLGGGSGIYAIAYLARNPRLRAIVFDRPEVLGVAREFAVEFGVEDRLTLQPGDMFRDPLPPADVVLLSNVLHDWDIPDCQRLISRCAEVLPGGGQLLVHDVFLNDALDGPLPVAQYSAALFTLTEGRAYSLAEYQSWLQAAGFECQDPIETLIHCSVLPGVKSGT